MAYTFIPFAAIPGDRDDLGAWESTLLNAYNFHLNTPTVYQHLSGSAAARLCPDMAARLVGKVDVLNVFVGEPSSRAPGRPPRRIRRKYSSHSTLPGQQLVKSTRIAPRHVENAQALLYKGCNKQRMSQNMAICLSTRNRNMLTRVYIAVRKSGTGQARLDAIQRIRARARQLKLQLPLSDTNVSILWPGSVKLLKPLQQHFSTLLTKACLVNALQLNAFLDGKIKIRLRYTASPSLRDMARNAPRFTKAIHAISHKDCRCEALLGHHFPHLLTALPDGSRHLLLRQSEFPWTLVLHKLQDLAGLAKLRKACQVVPCSTRLPPSRKDYHRSFLAAATSLIKCTKDPYNTLAAPTLTAIDAFSDTFATTCTNLVMDNLDLQPNIRRLQHVVHCFKEVHRLGLVVDIIDKNPNELSICCPLVWKYVTYKMFQHPLDTLQLTTGAEFTYSASDTTPWPDLDSFCSMEASVGVADYLTVSSINSTYKHLLCKRLQGREMEWGTARVLLKQSNLLKGRPLIDQSASPLCLIGRILARVIDLCLHKLPTATHFNMRATTAISAKLQLVNAHIHTLAQGSLTVASYDFESAFTHIQHDDALDAWGKLLQCCTALGLSECWVSANTTTFDPDAKLCTQRFASWTDPGTTRRGKWVKVQLCDVKNSLTCLLNFLFFKLAETPGKQTNGLSMGSAFASAVCILVLTMYEYTALQSKAFTDYLNILANKGYRYYGMRYVDDLRQLLVAPSWSSYHMNTQILDDIRRHIWHTVSPLKADNVNPTVGLLLFYDNTKRALRWLPAPKDTAAILTHGYKTATRPTTTLQPFYSFCSDAVRQGILIGIFQKACAQSSDWSASRDALTLFVFCLTHYCEFPHDYVHQTLHQWAIARVPTIPEANLLARRILHNVDAFHTRGRWVFSFNKDTMLATTQHSTIGFDLSSNKTTLPVA